MSLCSSAPGLSRSNRALWQRLSRSGSLPLTTTGASTPSTNSVAASRLSRSPSSQSRRRTDPASAASRSQMRASASRSYGELGRFAARIANSGRDKRSHARATTPRHPS